VSVRAGAVLCRKSSKCIQDEESSLNLQVGFELYPLLRLNPSKALVEIPNLDWQLRFGNRAHLQSQSNGVFGWPLVDEELINAVPAKSARSRFVVRCIEFILMASGNVDHLIVLSIQRNQRESILDCCRGDERIENMQAV